VPEIVENGRNGILVPPDNPTPLAGGLASMAADRTLLEGLREGARAASARYRQEAIYELIETELIRAVESPAPLA
jgi:glycosyltransferase involved in cell wall biosynthesis